MTETRAAVYANAAGLLARMGFAARAGVIPEPPAGRARAALVEAIITDAPPLMVGYAVAMVAEEPEAHLPERQASMDRVPRGKAGDPPRAFWL